jgi:tetratricopeptide (TPR) repeat protein
MKHLQLSIQLVIIGIFLAGADTIPAFDTPFFEDTPISLPLLLITYPIDAGQKNERRKNLWMYALLDGAAHFRLDYCTSFRTITNATLARYISPVVKGKETSHPEYKTLISELKVTHQLVQKFEINAKEKQVTLVIEITEIASGRSIVSFDTRFDFDLLGRSLDSCYFACIKGIARGNLSPEEVRFAIKPSLCAGFPNNKRMGELLYYEFYSGTASPRGVTEQYLEILSLEPSPLLLLWLKGKASYREGHLNEALSSFQVLYPLFPDNEACGLAIAKISLRKKDFQTAKFKLSSIVTSRPRPLPEVYRVLGDAFLQSGDTVAALDYYIKERTVQGNNPLLQEKIASTDFMLQRLGDAETEYEGLLSQKPSHPSVRYYLAYLKLKRGNVQQAESMLQAAGPYGKGSAYLWEPIGDCYAFMQKWEKAAQAWEKARGFDDKNPRIIKKIADAWINSGNDSLAAEYCVSLFAIDPDANAASLARAGSLFVKCKAWSRATKTFDTYLRAGYTDNEVTLSYARIMYVKKNWKKVIDLLKIYHGSTSGTEEALLMLARAWCETGKYNAAKPVLISLYGMNPRSLDIVRLSALAAEKTRDITKAAAMYEKTLAFPGVDDAPDIAFHIGDLYEKQKQPARAMERYEINIARYPSDARNYDRLIGLYTKNKQDQRLKIVLEKAINNVKTPASMNLQLARTYRDLGEHSKATEMFQTYLAREPRDAEAWRDLGALYYSQKRYSNAIGPLKRAAAKLTRDFDCQSMLGICYGTKGDYRLAVVPLERAYRIERRNLGAIERLAACYRNCKYEDKQFGLLKRWVALDKKRVDIRIELGSSFIARGKSKDAIKILEEALHLNPSNKSARQLLAKAQKMDNKKRSPRKSPVKKKNRAVK